jgi:hypothetical protein
MNREMRNLKWENGFAWGWGRQLFCIKWGKGGKEKVKHSQERRNEEEFENIGMQGSNGIWKDDFKESFSFLLSMENLRKFTCYCVRKKTQWSDHHVDVRQPSLLVGRVEDQLLCLAAYTAIDRTIFLLNILVLTAQLGKFPYCLFEDYIIDS